MRVQQGWLTTEGSAKIGHFRKTFIDKDGKQSRKPVARKLGPASMPEKEALEALRKLIVEETGVTDGGAVTLEGFIKSRWIPTREGDWRPSSRETILQKLGTIYERFNGAALKDIDKVALQTWINQLAEKWSASVVRTTHAYLKSIFAEAVEQDFIKKNPAWGLRVPKQLKPTKRPFLSMEEIAALLNAASPFGVQTMELALLRLMLVTGLRPSELFALRWRNIDLTPDNSTVTLESSVYHGVLRPYTKTSREGEAPAQQVLPEPAAQTLTLWHAKSTRGEPDDFVFPNADAGFIHSGNYLQRTLKPLAKQAKIKTPLTFQVLRRTVATHAQDLGSLKDVSTILRHKQMQTTQQVYVQVVSESVKAATGKLADKMFTAPTNAIN
jgi:integrase